MRIHWNNRRPSPRFLTCGGSSGPGPGATLGEQVKCKELFPLLVLYFIITSRLYIDGTDISGYGSHSPLGPDDTLRRRLRAIWDFDMTTQISVMGQQARTIFMGNGEMPSREGTGLWGSSCDLNVARVTSKGDLEPAAALI